MSLGKDPCAGKGDPLSSRAWNQGPLGVSHTPGGPLFVLTGPTSTAPGLTRFRSNSPVRAPPPMVHILGASAFRHRSIQAHRARPLEYGERSATQRIPGIQRFGGIRPPLHGGEKS